MIKPHIIYKKYPFNNRLVYSYLIIYFLSLTNCWPQAPNQPTATAQSAPGAKDSAVAPINNLITNIIKSDLVGKAALTTASITSPATDADSNKSNNPTQTEGANSTNSDAKKMVSLMYDDDELVDIQNVIDSLKSDRPLVLQDKGATDDKKPEKDTENNIESYVYLGSILYFDQKNWVAWINNKKISYDSNKANSELYLTSVSSSDVQILWTMSISKWKILSGKKNESLAPKVNNKNQVEITFGLKPNQTYNLRIDKVLEGMRTPLPNNTNDTNAAPGK